jgi:hypothetical protein
VCSHKPRGAVMNLRDAVCGWMDAQERKHGPHCAAEKLINEMTQYEFLQALSEGLEELLNNRENNGD